jgi:O-antigen/teichoic acid export membrane protein
VTESVTVRPATASAGGHAGFGHRVPRPRVPNAFLTYLPLNAVASAILFLYLLVPAHALAAAQYGLFASLFSVVVLLGVVFSAAQTYVAAMVARSRAEDGTGAVRLVLRHLTPWFVGLIVVLAITTPFVADLTHATVYEVVELDLLAAATFVWAATLGIIQGQQRFAALGWLNVSQALLRLAAVWLAVPLGIEGMLGATVVSMVPSITIALIVAGRRPKSARVTTPQPIPPAQTSMVLALVVAFVIGFPTVGDVILVHASQPAEAAGRFAVVAIIGRVIIFIGITLTTVAFPRFVARLGQPGERAFFLKVSGAVLLLGAPVLVVTALAPAWMLHFISSVQDVAPGPMLGYLAACLLFATASVGCYFQLARGNRKYVYGFLIPFVVALGSVCVVAPNGTILDVCLVVLATVLLATNTWLALRSPLASIGGGAS